MLKKNPNPKLQSGAGNMAGQLFHEKMDFEECREGCCAERDGRDLDFELVCAVVVCRH